MEQKQEQSDKSGKWRAANPSTEILYHLEIQTISRILTRCLKFNRAEIVRLAKLNSNYSGKLRQKLRQQRINDDTR